MVAQATPTPSANPALDGPHSIQLTLSSPSWVRVTVDGNVSMEGTFPAGTVKLFHGKSAVLRIGNGAANQFQLDVYGKGKCLSMMTGKNPAPSAVYILVGTVVGKATFSG